jgi:hypothetical protein
MFKNGSAYIRCAQGIALSSSMHSQRSPLGLVKNNLLERTGLR